MTTDILEIARLKDAAGREEATAEDQVACAQRLLEARLPDQALPYLLRASAAVPSAQLAALAGTVAVSIGHLDCAASQFELQLSRDPEAPEPFANLALIEATRENWTQAAGRFREALHRCPEEAEWHNDLGVILYKLEDHDGARRALTEALRLQPDYTDAAINLADLYETLGQRQDAFVTIAELLRYRPAELALKQRKDTLFEQLSPEFRDAWQERPLHATVYDQEYFETHLGTAETTRKWQQHRGRKLDSRFETVAQLARAGATDEVLDLGCGRGELAYYLSESCKQVVALDYSEPAVDLTREVCSDRANVEVVCADVKEIKYHDRFALVVLTDVVEHLHDWEVEDVLRRAHRALKSGGQLLIHSPVIGEIRLGEGEQARSHVVARELYDFPVHVNLMTFPELCRQVQSAGFVLGEVHFDGKVILEARKPDAHPKVDTRIAAPTGDPLEGKRFALFASNDAFLGDIRSYLESLGEVHVFTGGSRALMERELEWCDLAWFEWCDEFVQAATTMPKQCAMVCRLHSFEAFTHHPENVDWSKVDGLMFVNQSVRDLLADRIPSDLKTAVIPNGVDFNRFVFPTSKTYGKKVAYAGYLNFKKNPGFLLACFEALWQQDPERTFHMAGKYQGAHIQVFLEHMLPRLPFKVTFDGWVEDMPAWLADKDYILSSSYFESFHYAVAEGIAMGLLPLVYNWPGSENCYPAEVRFDTLAECAVVMARHTTCEEPYKRARALRDQLVSRFDLSHQLQRSRDFLADVLRETERTPQKPTKRAMPFGVKPYWEERLSRNFDLAGVGYLDLGETYNRYMYRQRADVLKDRLAALSVHPGDARILDVGSGTGFFLDFWRRFQPALLEGLDITDTATARLRERFGDLTIHQRDLASSGWTLPHRYDLISAFDVLFHIVDDAAFERALSNLAGSLADGGHLMLAIGYTHKTFNQSSAHYRARTEAEYTSLFKRLGLSLVSAEPMFVTMNSPLDVARVGDATLRELYEELWQLTQTLFGNSEWSPATCETAAHWAYLHERIHMHSGIPSPSSKLVIVRKEHNCG